MKDYYSRFGAMMRMGPRGLDRVESFALLKAWTAGGRILDVGCGTGYLTSHLGAVGVDVDSSALSRARAAFPATAFLDWSALLESGMKFDRVVCYNVLEHLAMDEIQTFFSRTLPRLLLPEGRAAFGYADPYHWFQLLKGPLYRSALFDPTHRQRWSAGDFLRLLGSRMEILEHRRTSPFTRLIPLCRHFKGDVLALCRPRPKA